MADTKLQIDLFAGQVATSAADLLVLPVFEGELAKAPGFEELDRALSGALAAEAARVDYTGKSEQQLELPTLGLAAARRVLLLGLGARKDLEDRGVRVYGALAARAGNALGVESLLVYQPDRGTTLGARALAEGLVLGAYRFTRYFTGERAPKKRLARVQVVPAKGKHAADAAALDLGTRVGRAVCFARDAVNEPPNELTPEGLAELARGIAKEHKLKLTVLDKAGIAKAGMKLHFAVGQGSANEPRFIHLIYKPKGATRKVAFVGKGLTFDSGGLCIKPAQGMGEMKSDMGGAAAVLGLMAAVCAVKPTVEVHVIVGAAENMPDGAAYRPGDVFGSLAGKTVEIINTDAEGRLVLADALTYAARLEPDLLVDAATLTGACLVALGKSTTGFFTAEDALAKRLERAAQEAGESVWRLPLLEELKEQLSSDIADLKHTGDRYGGAITAALFLREFTAGRSWIHCDIAGPSFADRAHGVSPKGGTGHAVLTFLRLVENLD